MAKAKLDLLFGKFLKVLRKVYINVSFTDTLSQMRFYLKVLKDILSNKIRLREHEIVALTEKYSAAIQNKLPSKLKDPDSFYILCLIGNVCIDHALCDLSASVSLMHHYLPTIRRLFCEIPCECFRRCLDKGRRFVCTG